MELSIEKIEIEVESLMPLIPNEPDDYLFKYDLKVTYPRDIKRPASEEKLLIAFARVVLMDAGCFEDTSLFEASDAHSQETMDLYEVFFDQESSLYRSLADHENIDEIWYIERFIIDPPFQNKGLGKAIIAWMVRFLCRCKGTIVVRPRPLKINKISNGRISIEALDVPELLEKLLKFYEKHGFTRLLTTPYMYRKANL